MECGGSTPLSDVAERLSAAQPLLPDAAGVDSKTRKTKESGFAASQSGVEPPHSQMQFTDAEMMTAVDTQEVRQQISEEQTTVDHRIVFEELVYKLKSRAHSDGINPQRCFLSYASGDQVPAWRNPGIEPWVARLADDLRKAGHDVVLDQTS